MTILYFWCSICRNCLIYRLPDLTITYYTYHMHNYTFLGNPSIHLHRDCSSYTIFAIFQYLGHFIFGLHSRWPQASLRCGRGLHPEQRRPLKPGFSALLWPQQAREPVHDGHQGYRGHLPRLWLRCVSPDTPCTSTIKYTYTYAYYVM